MCGISGIYSLSNKPIKNLKSRLELMTNLLHHRGPDQKGIYTSKNETFGLSNNRLSIVSPDEKIVLPFTKDKKNYLSFNGEIYNYLGIKKELKKFKAKFIGKTDTEVLYEFLKKYGSANLKKLNGMWSFAYYKSSNHELILSRDLMGERHLFYTVQKDELIFSSEVNPILAIMDKTKIDLDFNSIISSWKYNSCKPGKTLINKIKRLTAGSNLRIKNKKLTTLEHSKFEIKKWIKFFEKKPSENQVFKKFEKLFRNEVRLRIPKDVGFFSTLSGGIDSTILAMFLSKEKNFNAVFGVSNDEEKKIGKFSQLDLSRLVAKNFKIKHHLVYLNKSNAIIKNLKFFSLNSFDGCIDPINSNFSILAEYIKNKKSKVAFVADGPDELLGGYDVDIEANRMDEYLKNKPLKRLSTKEKQEIVRKFNIKKNKEFEFSFKPFHSRINHAVCPNSFLKKIIKGYNFNSIRSYGSLNSKYKNLEKKLDLSQMRALTYATRTLPDMFNLRIDKAFMKNTVEARLPFQAVKVVEFFLAMPKSYRFDKTGRDGKFFLRRYLHKRAPKKISQYISNRPKLGMGDYLWLKRDIYNKIKFDESIKRSNIFKKFQFKKNTKNILLDNNTHSGNKWAAYNYIKMNEKLYDYWKKQDIK